MPKDHRHPTRPSQRRSASRRPALSALLAACLWLLSAPLAAQDYPAITERIEGGSYGPITSLLIQRRGELVYEQYFRGSHRERLQLLNSVTKSVGATLIGMAHRRGLLDPEESVEALLPQYAWAQPPLAANRDLKLKHILQMRHGLRWDEFTLDFDHPNNSAARMFASPDWYAHTLALPRDVEPGTAFTYSSGVSTLMSGILRARTGRTPQQLFAEWLGEPLGIERFDWEIWSRAGPGSGIRDFPYGDAPLGLGLWLRPLDLLRIGELYLHGGVHDGKRLLDPEWIEASWTRYSDAGNDPYFTQFDETLGYGYQWWFREFVDPRGGRHPCWHAVGAGRQYLYVCPEDELIIVSTANSYSYSGPNLAELLREHVFAALAQPVTAKLSGFYFDPASDGQGISIEVDPTTQQAFAAWYTFAEGRQRWYVMLGRIEGDQVVFPQVLRVEGGSFLAATPVTAQSVGSASLQWDSCSEARLSYAMELGEGVYSLRRVAACPTDASAARQRTD